MLIDIKRRTIFIAGLKTASTSIEEVLAPAADIRLVRSEWGKHDSVAQMQDKFGWLFRVAPLSEFFIWAVIRDPVDVMWSLYRSHQHPKFAGVPRLFTGEMDFGTFLQDWVERNADQCRPQFQRFLDRDGRYAVDLLIPYESLDEAIGTVAPRYGMQQIRLPRMNASAPAEMAGDEKERFRSGIEHSFPDDAALLRDARQHLAEATAPSLPAD